MSKKKLQKKALELFKSLLQIDTSNPPGKESHATAFIERVFQEHKISYNIFSREETRPNIVARIGGDSTDGALLLSSHLDTVPVESEASWKFPPFSATEHDQMIWARGALDMKYKTAFDLACMIDLNATPLHRSLEFIGLADEETGGEFGARFVLSEHRQEIQATYVLNELGGMNIRIGEKVFFPIQVAEKGVCHIRIHSRGPSGHAAVPTESSAIVQLAQLLVVLDQQFLGFSLCDSARVFFSRVAAAQSTSVRPLFEGLMSAQSVEKSVGGIPDDSLRAQIKGMLCNTIAPTRIGGGFQINVIPEAAWVDLDCRTIPGTKPDEFIKHLEYFFEETCPELWRNCSAEQLRSEEGYDVGHDSDFYRHLAFSVESAWGEEFGGATAVPMLLPASSDNSAYSRAGLIPFGFAPLKFPESFPGMGLSHAVNERIPLAAFLDGFSVYRDAVRNWTLLPAASAVENTPPAE